MLDAMQMKLCFCTKSTEIFFAVILTPVFPIDSRCYLNFMHIYLQKIPNLSGVDRA